jgi:tetratricopeptide (TPR) repeat protein
MRIGEEIDYSFGSLELDGSFSVRCVKAKEYEPTAQDYFNNGNTKFNAKDYNGAIEEFSKAIELSPDSFLSYYYRGMMKGWLKNWNEARIDYEKSWKLVQTQNSYNDPIVKYLLFQLGGNTHERETSCYYYNEAVKYGSEEAKEYVKKCNEEKINDLIKSGTTKLTNKDFKGAIEDFNMGIELSPNKECADCFSQKGYAEIAMENWNYAIVDYLRAWEIIKKGNYSDESKGQTLLALAYSYLKVNNLDSACYFFKEAVKYKNIQAQEFIDKYCNKGEKVLDKEPVLQKGF